MKIIHQLCLVIPANIRSFIGVLLLEVLLTVAKAILVTTVMKSPHGTKGNWIEFNGL
jgi:hypothetical protein